MILEEAHKSKLSMHLGITKLYQDLKKNLVAQIEKGNGTICSKNSSLSKS